MDHTDDSTPHQGLALAGQILDWLPVDTKQSYDQLWQDTTYRQYVADQGWDQPGAITYRINSHGFRGDEFDDGHYLIALGCSYTLGIGLPESSTWPTLLAERMGLKCANLSWSGYGADSCYRLAEYWIPRLKTAYVCMLTPPADRIELLLHPEFLARDQDVLPPEAMTSPDYQHDNFVKHWFGNGKNSQLNQSKNVRALRWLCHEHRIPCMVLDAAKYMSRSREDIGYARDRMHGGPQIHHELADLFENGYKK